MRIIALFLAIFCFSAPPAFSAGARQKPQASGNTVKTDYFSLKIPAGWIMPQPVKKQPGDGLSAAFGLEKGDCVVTLNVMKVSLPAEELATQTAANMRKTGLEVSAPKNDNGFWAFKLSGKANGQALFGCDSGLCAATIIMGNSAENAAELLGAIKPIKPGLFPQKAMLH